MPAPQTTTLSPTELAYLHSSLASKPSVRPDARSSTTFRPLIAEVDFLPAANGSARVCFADGMEGIVGVKAEVEASLAPGIPHIASLEEDGSRVDSAAAETSWAEVSIDMPGQRDDDLTTTYLAQMVHEALLADGSLMPRLRINARWHWKLYIDILLLSPPASYPLPLVSISTHLALLSTRIPALISRGNEDPHCNDDWDASEPLYPSTAKPPVTLLVISVGDNVFFDPSREELAVADAVVAVTVTSAAGRASDEKRTLSIRTIDPPARTTSSSSAVLGGEPAFSYGKGNSDCNEGSWQPRQGGVRRNILADIVAQCVKPGGVAEEVLGGLEEFV